MTDISEAILVRSKNAAQLMVVMLSVLLACSSIYMQVNMLLFYRQSRAQFTILFCQN